MLHLEGEARDWSTYNEYSYNTAVAIIIAALPHTPISLLSFGGVGCRVSFTSSANRKMVGRQFTFFSGRQVIFFQCIFANTLKLA